MPPAGGKRTPLTQLAREPIASYTWGGWGTQNDITQFREVFQPDHGIFSPSYPLVPPERERVRLWDFPVGYNTTYTPRSYEPIGFDELRALAESHDITRDRDAQGPDREARVVDQIAQRSQPGGGRSSTYRAAVRVLAHARRRATVRNLAS
jgi:hypothetical protein